MVTVSVGNLLPGGVRGLGLAFSTPEWNKRPEQYERYLEEQSAGTRDVLVAAVDGELAGYVTIRWHPDYPPFREAGIPEVQDLNVLHAFRRRRVASVLMDEAERRIAVGSRLAGIGVGMDPEYGAAQRMYVRRGYVPDGRGLTWHNQQQAWGATVRVDDDLVLYFTKSLDRAGTEH